MKLATLSRHDGEGRVWTTTNFETLTDIERLDLLKDWIFDLQQIYAETHKQTFDFDKNRRGHTAKPWN